MFIKVTFLIFLTRFPYKTCASSVCTPNSQTLLNGKICNCNTTGHWNEKDCITITRRVICTPGQVVFQGCNRCICQENGQLACTENTSCSGPVRPQNVHETLSMVLPWCKPFRSYYISCNICLCPASGKTSESRCVLDISCTLFKEPSTSDIASKKNTCIPKVMYLFLCLHCLCSDEGYFNLEKCVETCIKQQTETNRRCIPKTLYRNGCNVCQCPENSIPDDKLCTNSTCVEPTTFGFLRTIKNKPLKCTAHEFVAPRCVYCDCNHDGAIDEKTCLELPCLKSSELKYDTMRKSCSPGEMVPYCTECLCTSNGVTSDDYCSSACSYQSKLKVLEKIVNMPNNEDVIERAALKQVSEDKCKPGTIYIDQGRYCLCSETGNSNFNLCTAAADKSFVKKSNKPSVNKVRFAIDFNATCEPSTFVEFDCNTCFCSKKGKIDPKWCTYDDCESKRIIQETHITNPASLTADETDLSDTCTSGSISNIDCNFCICPASGDSKDKVCTKNDCSTFVKPLTNNDKFACEPLAYYEVDCNICFCPRDGIKNVAKCTKNHCERSFLRSDVCVPGQLFSDECNVCVCPPNGNKAEKACTNYTCADTAPWKKIFQLSESLLGNHITEDGTRNLDLCFPGEEFIAGCKLCVCPDMGLRMYATCSPTFCEEERISEGSEISGSNREVTVLQKMNTRRENCMVFNFTSTFDRHLCTPGSMYIVRCKECICPYMGEIHYFCRPLPKDFYCEQAFPDVNYVPMGRRNEEEPMNSTILQTQISNATATGHITVKIGNKTISANATRPSVFKVHPVRIPHEHSRYECNKPGTVMDDCFMCECDGKSLIAEHCFQSEAPECAKATPKFLKDYVKPKH